MDVNTKVQKKNLPYREGVQAYIIEQEKILILKNVGDERNWKIPSGGVDPEEKPELTVKREMMEELNVEVEIIKKCSFKNKYNWPDKLVSKSGFKYQGQNQTVFIVKIKDGQKIKSNKHEIKAYKWIKFKDVSKSLSIDSQKKMTIKVINIYKSLNKR